MGSKVNQYVNYIESIADDNSHGYSQYNRWGTPDYDCSSLVISAVQSAGIPVRTQGATYTGNMYNVFIKCGFMDVTNSINLKTGKGLIKGDILLNTKHHTETYIGNGRVCGAKIDENGKIIGSQKGDQTGKEICRSNYYNYPWNYVLRYPEESDATTFDETKVSEFVERLYQVVLLRKSDDGGKKYWVDKLRNGETGAYICKGFFGSQEFLAREFTMNDSDYVETLYNAFFGRPSDTDGKEHWLTELREGTSRENLLDGFINSVEFANLCKTYGINSGGIALPTI